MGKRVIHVYIYVYVIITIVSLDSNVNHLLRTRNLAIAKLYYYPTNVFIILLFVQHKKNIPQNIAICAKSV